MDERTAELLLYVDATLAEMVGLAARGRAAYDSDIAVARACQYNVVRLAADIERLGESWIEDNSFVPWRLIKGMRNRIAHNYWTIDDDVVWSVVEDHAPALRNNLADQVREAQTMLGTAESP